jgi:hypothetical protein
MQKLSLILSNKLNVYVIANYEGAIAFLYDFLIDIPLQAIPFYIQWAQQSLNDTGETNSTILIKNSSHIIIGSLFSEQKDKGPFFQTSIAQFIKLLQEWEKLVATKTKKITITQSDDGIMSISGE